MSPGAERGLRVLFVCSSDLDGPSEKQVLWFARALAAGGHKAMLSFHGDRISAEAEGVGRSDSDPAIIWHTFTAGKVRKTHVEVARRFEPDVIHAWNSRPPVEVPARAYAQATGAPVFVHWEDDEWGHLDGLPARSTYERARHLARRGLHRLHPPLWNLSTARSLEWAEKAVAFDAITPELAREVRRRTSRDCAVILPASPAEAWTREGEAELPARLGTRHVLLYTGDVNFGRAPDVRLGIEAAAIAQRRGLRVAFVHAGRNTAGENLAAEAERVGLERETLVELGTLPYRRIPPLLRRAAILLQPGRPTDFNRFGLPSKLQSYLASGTPCITFAIGAGELLRDRIDVLKTLTGSPDELADRIEELLTDEDLRSTLATNAPLTARRLFNPTRNAAALADHYRAALGHPG